MSSLSPIPVPEWLRPGLMRSLDCLPDTFVRNIGLGFPGGFTKRDAILRQWKLLTNGFPEVSGELCDAIRAHLPVYQVTRALEGRYLVVSLGCLAGLVGTDLLCVALWLDLRPDVQALARPETLADPGMPTSGAKATWTEWITKDFLAPFGLKPADSSGSGSKSPDGQQSSVHQLARTQKWLEDCQKRLSEAQARHISEMEKLRKESESEIRGLTESRDAVLGRLSELETRFLQTLRGEMDSVLGAQLRPWYARVVAVEEQVDSSSTAVGKLVGEINGALERQRHQDRHQANLSRLRDDLHTLSELRDKIQLSRSESLHPLREWPALEERVGSSIRAIQKQLGEIPSGLPWATKLAADLHSAGSSEAVEAVLIRARQLVDAGLLEKEAMQWLCQRGLERQAVLADPVLQSFPPLTVRLQEVLDGQQAGIIVIDVYNWIGRAGGILGVSSEPSSFTASLKELRPLLKKWGTRAKLAEFLLFVDGPSENSVSWSPNVRLTWTGGVGQHRADAVIRGHLEYLHRQKNRYPIWVVSDDREVRGSAVRWQAAIEPCDAFSRRLKVSA